MGTMAQMQLPRVLSALQSKMLTPELVSHFVTSFEEEITRQQRESACTQARLQSQLSAVERKLEGVLLNSAAVRAGVPATN